MEFDLWTTILFSFQRGHGRHVAADTVPNNGEIFPVHPDLIAVFSHPFRSGVNLVDGLWILSVRSLGLVDEDSRESGQNDEIPHHPLMRRVIAQHPTAAMYKDEDR